MKNNMSNGEKLRRSSKALTLFLTGAIIVEALFLFSTQIEYSIFLGISVLFAIPIIWILNYFILTICDMEDHIYTLNQNFVEYAKHVMKPKGSTGAKSDDKKDS